MAEWIKILVSTLLGFLAGQIAEPLKNAVQLKMTVLRMQRAVIFDCVRARIVLEGAQVGLVPEDKAWQGTKLQAFEYYWEKSRELFFNSLPLQLLASRCQLIQNIQMSVVQGHIGLEQGRSQILRALDEIAAEMPKAGFVGKHLQRLFL